MSEVKLKSVPKIKYLRVEDFAYFIENKTEGRIDYLPEKFKEMSINRQWEVNLCI